MTTLQILWLIFSYLFGALPFGVLVSRMVSKADITKHGSGNIGATNVARVVGKKWGILVLFLDAFKGYALVAVAAHLGSAEFCNAVAVAAVVGHCYPVYLRFRGGKGVATTLGVLLALSPAIAGLSILVFAVTVATTRIVSAASLMTALTLLLWTTLLRTHLMMPASLALALIVWWKHKDNIRRLFRRQEPKFF